MVKSVDELLNMRDELISSQDEINQKVDSINNKIKDVINKDIEKYFFIKKVDFVIKKNSFSPSLSFESYSKVNGDLELLTFSIRLNFDVDSGKIAVLNRDQLMCYTLDHFVINHGDNSNFNYDHGNLIIKDKKEYVDFLDFINKNIKTEIEKMFMTKKDVFVFSNGNGEEFFNSLESDVREITKRIKDDKGFNELNLVNYFLIEESCELDDYAELIKNDAVLVNMEKMKNSLPVNKKSSDKKDKGKKI